MIRWLLEHPIKWLEHVLYYASLLLTSRRVEVGPSGHSVVSTRVR